MTEPTQQSVGIIDEIKEGMQALEQKVEHLIHPDAPEVAQVGEPVASSAETSATQDASQEQPTMPETNASSAASVQAESQVPGEQSTNTAQPAADEPTNGIVGLVDTGNPIRNHLANIKRHLSVRGFELSAVADINAELDAIERLL